VYAQECQLQQIIRIDSAAERTAEERVQARRPPFKQKLERAQIPCGVVEHELFVLQPDTPCPAIRRRPEKVSLLKR
jgi:hypothetical protein